MNKLLHNSGIGLFMVCFVAGCGSGSSSSENSSCINIKRPTVGLKYSSDSSDLTYPSNNVGLINRRVIELNVDTFNNVSKTQSGRSVASDGNTIAAISSESTFTILDDYMNISYFKNSDQSGTVVNNYSPPQKQAIDRVCENQTWNNSYDVTGSINTGNSVLPNNRSVASVHTIESINEAKTVTAGTFTTFKEMVEYGDSTKIIWRDQNSGTVVFQETRNNLDEITGTQELTSLSYGD